jgi:hypothetical protein
VIIAVPESGHLHDPTVIVSLKLELLRKDRMRNGDVAGEVSAICDYDPGVVQRGEQF